MPRFIDRYNLDRLTQRYTAFRSFREMTDETASTYRPSMDMRQPELAQLADAYDAEMTARGDARRVYRYGAPC